MLVQPDVPSSAERPQHRAFAPGEAGIPSRDTYDSLVAGLGGARCQGCGQERLRVGTDVQAISTVAEAVLTHGERYLNRVYTAGEVSDAAGSPPEWQEAALASLAARFAAKEAMIKVLRPTGRGYPWTQIEVVRRPGGWCALRLSGEAERAARDAALIATAVSFAHDGGAAVATVVAHHDCSEDRPLHEPDNGGS